MRAPYFLPVYLNLYWQFWYRYCVVGGKAPRY